MQRHDVDAYRSESQIADDEFRCECVGKLKHDVIRGLYFDYLHEDGAY